MQTATSLSDVIADLAQALTVADSRLIGVYLQTQYDVRRQHNPAYSLRAFARDLDLDATDLSKVLRHKKTLSAKTVGRIAVKLQLPEETRRVLVALAAMRELNG